MNGGFGAPKRKPKPLTRKPMPKTRQRRKLRVDIDGLMGTDDWRHIKQQVLLRPLGGRCERCGEQPATDAHHRLLVSQGGADVPSNLASLCRKCHDWCHAHPVDARSGGWIVVPGGNWRTKALQLHDGSIVLLGDDYGYSFVGYPKGHG